MGLINPVQENVMRVETRAISQGNLACIFCSTQSCLHGSEPAYQQTVFHRVLVEMVSFVNLPSLRILSKTYLWVGP